MLEEGEDNPQISQPLCLFRVFLFIKSNDWLFVFVYIHIFRQHIYNEMISINNLVFLLIRTYISWWMKRKKNEKAWIFTLYIKITQTNIFFFQLLQFWVGSVKCWRKVNPHTFLLFYLREYDLIWLVFPFQFRYNK